MSDERRIVDETGPIVDLPASACAYGAAGAMEWTPAKPGILVKTLYDDAGSAERTLLFKLEPYARSAPHSHAEREQIFVLEGSFHDGERWLRAGDLCVRPPGVVHSAHTEEGALALVVYTPAPTSGGGAGS